MDTLDQRCFAIYSLPGSTANLNALNLLLVLKPTVLRHQLHLLAGQFRPLSADIMPSWASRPTAVRLPALGRETGARAGACIFPACRFHVFLSHLSPGWVNLALDPIRYWSFRSSTRPPLSPSLGWLSSWWWHLVWEMLVILLSAWWTRSKEIFHFVLFMWGTSTSSARTSLFKSSISRTIFSSVLSIV